VGEVENGRSKEVGERSEGVGSKEVEGSETTIEDANCSSCADSLAGWKRALADYDNLQKDLLRQREEIRERVKEGFAHDLIAVLDNFDQAVKFAPQDLPAEVTTWLVGVTHVQNQFVSVLEGLGLESFGAVGDVFDPHLHNAADERDQEGAEEGSVIEIIQRGWKLGDKVVRPANVIVRK